MTRLIAIHLFAVLCLPLYGQTTVKGIATKISSAFTPVQGVEIVLDGGAPSMTDDTGNFCISLPHSVVGDLVTVRDIYKKGMEVVNIQEINQWVASEDIVYKIVLCEKGYLETARRKFYNIGKSSYQQEYVTKLGVLKQQRVQNKLDSLFFEQKLVELNDEYDRQMKVLSYYADKFARINKDELQDIERRAIELVEKGDIDAAIRMYEESGIYQNFTKKVAQRDSVRKNIKDAGRLLFQQIEWYMNEGSAKSVQKADSLRRRLKEMGYDN